MDAVSPRLAQDVVLVDDDAAVLAALQFSLELQGYAVRGFPDAESLLAAKDAPTEGCLVVDYHLPGMDGLELLRRLRLRGVTLPAVLITTPTGEIKTRAAADGVGIVEKPLLGDGLVEAVRRLIAGY